MGVPGSRQSRKQNKNQQNEKHIKTKTNYWSHVKTDDPADNLPVANKLSVSRYPLSQELNSPVSLPVANKKTEESVKHPDDKWLKDVLTKTTKCQPAARDTPPSGHTLHTPRVTVVVPVSGHLLSGHTLHTPRVTVVVPVNSQGPNTSQVTVGVPDSRLARLQNKNKQNEKYKNQKSNYLSHVTVVNSVKLTKLLSQSQVYKNTCALKSRSRSNLSGQTLHTPQVTAVVPAGGQTLSGHTPHTPRVTEEVPVSSHMQSGHTPHTPRVTVVVPVRSPHTPRVTEDHVHRSRSRSRPSGQGQHTPRVTVSLNFKHKVLRFQSRSHKPSHGQHTPRVTVVHRPRSRSNPSSHGRHTPRVTVGHRLKVNVLLSRSQPSGHGTAVTPGLTFQQCSHRPVTASRSQSSGHSGKVNWLWSQSRSKLSSLVSTVMVATSTHYTSSDYYISCVMRYLPVTKFHFISNKTRNNLVKQSNGNGKNTISVCHWNLGSKKWSNKLNQIQALADQNLADIIFISEANLDELTPVYESQIMGYNITLPKTVTVNGTARLVMLAKNSLDFKIKDDLMDNIFTSIWIKISRPGAENLLICGIYREHQYLKQDTDWSLQPIEQNRRWSNFLSKVETARISATCHIIGDFNLDYTKWNNPDHLHLQMINDSKYTLEAGGFVQLVTDVTRSWPGQSDSLIDHFWTNDAQKIVKVSNIVRAVGDHNVITASIRLKGSDVRKLDIRKRSYKIFDPVLYRQKLDAENWSEIYEITDVNLANDFIESRIVKILDEMCPFKTVQFRKDCKTWVTDETKTKIKLRDDMREQARNSGNQDSWTEYRRLRNNVNRLVNKDRKRHYDLTYKRHLINNDVGATYQTAKSQAGISKNSTQTSFIHEGRKVTDPQAMADIQMKVFTDKIDKLISDLPPPDMDPCSLLQKSLDDWGNRKDAREVFKFKTITNIDTLKVIRDLANSTSSAHDRLDALALKHGASMLHGPLTHVINTSIKSSRFASRWKIGKLLPLHKPE